MKPAAVRRCKCGRPRSGWLPLCRACWEAAPAELRQAWLAQPVLSCLRPLRSFALSRRADTAAPLIQPPLP